MAADEPSLRPLKAKGVRQPRRSGICRLALFDNRAPDAGDAVERILAPQSRRCMEPKLADRFALSGRSEEHTSELQSLMRISSAVFCLKKKKYKQKVQQYNHSHPKHKSEQEHQKTKK